MSGNEEKKAMDENEDFNEEALLEDYADSEEEDDPIMEFDEAEDGQASEGTELATFESAEIEEKEFLDDDKVESIVESVLFASDKPITLNHIRQAFQGTQVKKDKIRKALDALMVEYAGARRGVSIEEVQGGYQVRTKVDNVDYLKRMQKARPFKLSGPALEVMAIVAYKQPIIKNEVDQIRGVESGHLMRALMDKRLIKFVGKSELPGKPMLYGTTKYFLEVFGLRNLNELPSLSEIDELIPEGIGEQKEEEDLASVSANLGLEQGESYSESEEELGKISDKLAEIDTTTEFFEQEKQKEKERRDAIKAREIREAIEFEEEVSSRDRNWLEKYEARMAEKAAAQEAEANQQESEDSKEQEELSAEADGSQAESAEDNEAPAVLEGENLQDLQSQMAVFSDSAEMHPASEDLTDVDFVEEEELDTFDFDAENKDREI